jgi:hypothetical protein
MNKLQKILFATLFLLEMRDPRGLLRYDNAGSRLQRTGAQELSGGFVLAELHQSFS